MKADEVRLAEMNEIAMQLVSLGQTEAAMKIQLEDLNKKWSNSKGKLGELSTLLEYSSTMLESSSVAACKFKHNA